MSAAASARRSRHAAVHRPFRRTRRTRRARPSQGLAALLSVMIIFMVLALVAAYMNRHLLIDQKLSASALRSNRAVQAAEAGVDWTLTMLNGGRIDEQCELTDVGALDDFRERYLEVYDSVGRYRVVEPPGSAARFTGCRLGETGSDCVCPLTQTAGTTLEPDAGSDQSPAFRVSYTEPRTDADNYPGTVIVQVRGCSHAGSGAASCFSPSDDGLAADAVISVRMAFGLVKALPELPMATLTAAGDIDIGSATFSASNPDADSALVLHAGGAVVYASGSALHGPAGTPDNDASLEMQADAALAALAANDGLFENLFRSTKTLFKRRPGVVLMDCTTTSCDANTLATQHAQYPGRILWVEGDIALDDAPTAGLALGDNAHPLLLVVNGTLTVNGPVDLTGLVYADTVAWGDAAASLRGAMAVGGNFTAAGFTGAVTLAYDRAVMDFIAIRYGSFVRIPGSWTRGQFLAP